MDWDDKFDNTHDGMTHDLHSGNAMPRIDPAAGLDPTNMTDPASAYFLLSDDAQDEIAGSDKKRMKCRSCGHRFKGEIYDRCPKCDSLDTEEMLSFIAGEEDGGEVPIMKCLSCGHKFVGNIYDRCPECYSSNTDQKAEENDEGS